MLEIKDLEGVYKQIVVDYVIKEWGDPIITCGNVIDIFMLSGFVAIENNKLIGAILYQIQNDDCEIVVLFSLVESRGAGTELINTVIELAKSEICNRVWLITTNDNTHAIRFYQRKGFDLKAVHINAFNITRKLKNELTEENVLGIDDIPIKHEFEFEIIFPL